MAYHSQSIVTTSYMEAQCVTGLIALLINEISSIRLVGKTISLVASRPVTSSSCLEVHGK